MQIIIILITLRGDDTIYVTCVVYTGKDGQGYGRSRTVI